MTFGILKRGSVADERPVDDLDIVDYGHAIGSVERELLARAVIHAQGDAVARYLFRVLFDLVAGNRAADDAGHGGEIFSAASADLIPDDAADHAARDRATAGGLAFLGEAFDRFDRAAFTA